ncbi:MAG: ABC transporter substrate-binding protein, partial [Planctomycetes bacterium]|nr:ABC transporter substrate-binding protein [Planctomycetota bacterium]
LGQGGMGVVFEAIDTKLQRPVALKVMKPDIARDESARKRFLREARATASVRSDHVVVIHQVDEYNRVPFLAMEFLQGEPLDKWLDVNGRPSLHDGLRIGIEIARGLAAAHEIGLIHRDIKPSNIWLEKRDAKPAAPPSPDQPARPGRVKILDFGLARIARDQAHLTHSGLVLGTPAYMAPEQAEGGDVDARGDLFSLGCVLYDLATGSKPFSGTNTMAVLMSVAMKDPLPPQQINPDLPPSLAQLIMRLLSKRPADRPASASEVAAELEAIIDELGFSAKTPPSGLSRAPTVAGAAPSPTRGLTIGLSIGIFLVLLGLAVGAYWIFGRGEREIVLGMSGPLNGPSKELGREMELGIKIYLRHINDQGGIHGRKLRLIALDDGYEPDSAIDNMKKLREDHKVFAVIGNIGTPTALKTVPYAVDNKMLFFGAFTGARVLRKVPPDRYVFNYRASYEEETAKIVEYLVEIRKDKVLPEHIAVFAQNDGYGDAGFNGVAKVMREKYKRDANKILRVGYERNTIQVHDAVKTILKRTDLRAVVMVGTYKPITEFIRQIKDAGRDMIFTNVSFVGSEALADGLKELGPKYAEGVIVTQVVPPIDLGASIVLKYHELRKKYYPNERATFSSLEGYISTALFIEGLKRAGDDPTPEKVIDALEQINGLDLGTGSTLSFSSSEHQASHTVWATVLDKTGTFRVLDLNE